VAETTVERLLCRGFRRTATILLMLVDNMSMSRNKCFPGLTIIGFTFYILFADSPSYIYMHGHSLTLLPCTV
jgi:hypothetical protein